MSWGYDHDSGHMVASEHPDRTRYRKPRHCELCGVSVPPQATIFGLVVCTVCERTMARVLREDGAT